MAAKKTTKVTNKKVNTVADLRTKSISDLDKILITAKQDLLQAKKSLKADELANPHVVTKMRKEVARIKTVMTELSKKPVEEVTNDKKGAK